MGRSRSTSRSRATPKSPSKSPASRRARKSEPVSEKKSAAGRPKKSSASPARSPARAKASASKTPPRTKSPPKAAASSSSTTIRSRTRSRSTGSRSAAATAPRPSSPTKAERTHTISPVQKSPVHTPETHKRSPSPIFSSTRPRRAAYNAANREFGGTESARYLNTRRVEPVRTRHILPSISWPHWFQSAKNHWHRHQTLYSVLLTVLFGLIASYLFGKQMQRQLHLIHQSLGEIYDEQKRRFDSMIEWESPTEKAARESALPAPHPPHQEPAPNRPPNPHIPKIPKAI